MNYQDSRIKISDKKIRFWNNIFIRFLLLFIITTFFYTLVVGTIITKFNINTGIVSSFGAIIIFFIFFRYGDRFYWRNTIELSKISHVKILSWNLIKDLNSNFEKSEKYNYHFPTGIDKKGKAKVVFIFIDGRKNAVGFSPEYWDKFISVLKGKEIEIIERNF